MKIIERPDLMEKWAFEENEADGLSPDQISVGSGKKAWWKCIEKHHLYQRTIDKEANKNPKCPVCRKESQNYVSDYPKLMEKWAFEENEADGLLPDQISVGSNKKAWWKCVEKHHLYQRAINKEVAGSSKCPVCKKENQKYLSDYPELVKEFAYDLNDIEPNKLTEGSDTVVKWRCKKCENVWATAPYHRTKENTGCPYCSNKKLLQGFNDLETVNPPNFRYWDYDRNTQDGILASNYSLASKQKAWWICDNGHHTYDSIKNFISRKTTLCSECLKEKKQASIDSKYKKIKIQKAAKAKRESMLLENQKALLEKQNKYIDIVGLVEPFWDYDENKKRGFELKDVSTRRIYCWKCFNGHKWKSDLYTMLNNQKCPECIIEENSIAKKYPYLINVYNSKKNDGIPPEQCLAVGTKYYWWTCQKGHTFVATLNNVAKHKKTGCMYCDEEKSFYSL